MSGIYRDDVNMLVKFIETNGTVPKGFVYDVSRSGMAELDLAGVESIANGSLVSGKYKSQFCRFSRRNMVIMCNTLPLKTGLSADRRVYWDLAKKYPNLYTDNVEGSAISKEPVVIETPPSRGSLTVRARDQP